ncbi:DNA-processing protein DprA [Cupriavidus sp. DF5525]|uniref:DprA-like winged helix domain-containing protein n=1 Tax=Cupriavidus sp. DF5525 TaxID=3160989 RepID=UPI0035A84B6E
MLATWLAAAAAPGDAAAGPGRRDSTRDPDDVMAWLRLACAPGVGPVAARLLLAAFGLPQQVLAQSVEALSSVVPQKQARAVLAAPGAALSGLAARTLAWLDTPGNHLVTLADDAYPRRLFDLPDPPPLLYIKGDPALLARPAVAIVGARGATPPAQPGRPDFSDFADPSDPLLAALGYDPVTLDALCERSGQPPEAVAARLLELELAGHAERLPGNLFRRLG